MARRPEDSPAPPRISPPDLPARLDSTADVSAGGDLFQSDVRLPGPHADVAHASLTECRISPASVDSVTATGANLIDVEIAELKATTLSARGARLRRVRWVGGRVGSLDLGDADLDELELRGIRIDYLSFAGARVRDVVVADCRIGTIDLPQALAHRLAFADCVADEMDTRGLQSADVDLRGLAVASITDPSSLRGTTLTPAQIEHLAPAFAASLGIQVRDEGPAHR